MGGIRLESGQLKGREPVRHLRGRNRTKPEIRFYDLPGLRVAVKDYAGCPWAVRHSLGRWLVRRECRAYAAAEGLEGLPRFLGRLGPFALATEWLAARPLAEHPEGTVAAAWFDRAEQLLERMHARGIAVGDLHRRDLLVADDGRALLVDLAMAWVCGAGTGWPSRRIFELLRDVDRVALTRLRLRYCGGDPDADVAREAGVSTAWYRHVKRFKLWLNRMRRRRTLP